MEVSPGTKLNNNNQSTVNYKSFGGLPQVKDVSPTKDFIWALQRDHDLSHLPHEIPLKPLASGSPSLFAEDMSVLKGTDEDSLPERQSQGILICLCGVCVTVAIGVTIALILQIYLGDSTVFIKGVLVSDHERCTVLGEKVLHDQGSSVDAAIAAALCLGVVHPHMSGIGGGGVMLVHDISKRETRVINFQGTAPNRLKEEMLQNSLETGLQVGVPGMLRGLHQAHSLYGRMSWEDVVIRAADIAQEGFNVSHSLAEAISQVKDERVSQRFRDVFIPGGLALLPGSFLRLPSLAGVLEAGVSNFYNGNLTQEIEDEVRANGGVLSREDISNYSVEVEQPLEGLYDEFTVQVPPPPSVGAALISAFNLLQGFHLSERNVTVNQTYHWIAESLKAALAMASGLGDPMYNSSVSELLSDMLSKSHADMLHQRNGYSHASLPEYYSPVHSLHGELVASQVVVMGSDDLIVSVASSLSRPFGSRIITTSGIILNSHILDFSWPNKTQGITNQRNRIQPGKKPLSLLLPTIVLPAWHTCGISMALSNSDLSGITQVLINALFYHKEKNESFSLGRLHPQFQPNKLLVEAEFPEKGVGALHEKGHIVRRVKTHSVVRGIQRNKDIIVAMAV